MKIPIVSAIIPAPIWLSPSVPRMATMVYPASKRFRHWPPQGGRIRKTVNQQDRAITRSQAVGFAAVDDYQTGRENVEMVGRLYGLSITESKRRAEDVLERIRLAEAADRQVKTYSGGMQRRLDLAASLVGRPEVLFLDEPTTGIDPRSRLDVWELITDLVEGGTTVLLTTQYLDEADQLADRIAVIDEGRLISEGTSDDLKDTLGGSVIELSVPEDQERQAIEALAAVSGSEPLFNDLTREITVAASEGAKTLTEVVRALDAASIVPNDLALHKPSLDDVFLTLTGHPAEEKTEDPAESAGSGRRRRRK